MSPPEPQSQIIIRDARPTDAASIAVFMIRMAMETENLRLDPNVVASGVRHVFEDASRGRYFVAEADGIVIACLLVTHEWSDWRDGDMWWIQSVYVHPDYRRRGVFRALHQHVRSQAIHANVATLRLYVDKSNDRAKSTYTSLGMQLSHYEIMEEILTRSKD
jgi:ribosomal protein S18 acetylase RimI-like enzyme